MFGSEGSSGRSELLHILAGIKYPSEGTATVLHLDCRRILRGMTFGQRDEERDNIHGGCFLVTVPGCAVLCRGGYVDCDGADCEAAFLRVAVTKHTSSLPCAQRPSRTVRHSTAFMAP